jgi:hypothetical protein
MRHAAIRPVFSDQIDDSDVSFRITTEEETGDLVQCIEAVGVLNPPVLLPDGARWRVVAGFRRIAACRRLGFDQIQCRTLPASIPPLDCARIAVADNTGQRRLNALELSRAYRLLSMHLASAGHLPQTARSVGLPDNPKLVDKVRSLCRLPEPIQEGVMTDHISLSVVRELEQMPEPEALGFARWFLSVPLSLNRQREVLVMVREIARREDLPVSAVLDLPAFSAVVDDPEMEGGRKGRELHSRLRRRRFPALSRAEEDFERRSKRLDLADGMALVPPRHFEGGRFELRLSFSKAEALEKMLEAARPLARSRELEKMLKGG